jgi:SAM-dependent methyltransferase
LPGQKWPGFFLAGRQIGGKIGAMEIVPYTRAAIGHYRRLLNPLGRRWTRILDFGCGAASPFAVAAVFCLNGAEDVVCCDLRPAGSELLANHNVADILADCAGSPHDWLLGDSHPNDLRDRIGGYFRHGAPIHHHVGDVSALPGRFDLIVSHAVMEHVERPAKIWRDLTALLAPGGVMCHVIDYTDHRVHDDSSKHYWSHLLDGHLVDINGVRSEEMAQLAKSAGLKILSHVPLLVQKPPAEVYRAAPHITDLEIITSGIVAAR